MLEDETNKAFAEGGTPVVKLVVEETSREKQLGVLMAPRLQKHVENRPKPLKTIQKPLKTIENRPKSGFIGPAPGPRRPTSCWTPLRMMA